MWDFNPPGNLEISRSFSISSTAVSSETSISWSSSVTDVCWKREHIGIVPFLKICDVNICRFLHNMQHLVAILEYFFKRATVVYTDALLPVIFRLLHSPKLNRWRLCMQAGSAARVPLPAARPSFVGLNMYIVDILIWIKVLDHRLLDLYKYDPSC